MTISFLLNDLERSQKHWLDEANKPNTPPNLVEYFKGISSGYGMATEIVTKFFDEMLGRDYVYLPENPDETQENPDYKSNNVKIGHITQEELDWLDSVDDGDIYD